MGYQIGKSIGTILKTHYERLLFPFDVFKQGKTVNIVSKIICILISINNFVIISENG